MADQGRWFKLWVSAPYDDHLLRLPPADRWAWAAVGAYAKEHGTAGKVIVSETNAALAVAMGVPLADLISTLERLPHMRVQPLHEGPEKHHGTFAVTWDNWIKYQEDTTRAERQRKSRAKKRGEEKRRDSPPNPPERFLSSKSKPPPEGAAAPTTVQAVLARINSKFGEAEVVG